MKFRKPTGFFFISALLVTLLMGGMFHATAHAFQAETATLTPGIETVYITVTYVEPVHVRGGPNAVYYPIVGTLPIGAVQKALGRSLAGEWVKIVFPEANDGSGVGWVYANLVTISPGFLPIMEPPPTAAPVIIETLDPDMVASLQPAATPTRLATFTAPAPLVLPTYENPIDERRGFSAGELILILGGVGMVGLLIASIRRSR